MASFFDDFDGTSHKKKTADNKADGGLYQEHRARI